MKSTRASWINALFRAVVVVSILFPFSFTVSGRQADDPVPEKERTRGDFTANISLAFPVFSSGPEKFGYETIIWRRASTSVAWSPKVRSTPIPR